MAANAEEKTEAPTPRRRSEARSNGQVAKSQDLTAATMLLTAFLSLYLFGPSIWAWMLRITRAALSGGSTLHIGEVLPFGVAMVTEALKQLAPFLAAIFLSTIVVLLAQTGILFTLKPLVPSLTKINPLNGIKRLFSVRSVMLAAINFGKLLVVAGVAYATLLGGGAAILYSFGVSYHELILVGSDLMFTLSMRLAGVLLLLALFDLAWQRYRHERDLRMTKEEVKDEMRSMEGDPTVKRRRREVQLQLSMQRLRKDVPEADVVVTNPTHYSVAIKYDPDTMAAPKVVAKGADYMALRIRQIAQECGIPIVERPPLARTLFRDVEVGDFVPDRLYRAIAEILAYVYELTGQSGLRHRTAPSLVAG